MIIAVVAETMAVLSTEQVYAKNHTMLLGWRKRRLNKKTTTLHSFLAKQNFLSLAIRLLQLAIQFGFKRANCSDQ